MEHRILKNEVYDLTYSDGKLQVRIKAIIEIRELLDNYKNGKSTFERYRKGVSIVKSGTW